MKDPDRRDRDGDADCNDARSAQPAAMIGRMMVAGERRCKSALSKDRARTAWQFPCAWQFPWAFQLDGEHIGGKSFGGMCDQSV
jgi:hypothetical protein